MSRKQKVVTGVPPSLSPPSPPPPSSSGSLDLCLEELVCLLDRCCVLVDSGEVSVLGVDAAWVRRHLESALSGVRKGLK